LDKHNNATGDRFVELEAKLAEFINKLETVAIEMEKIKVQQNDLIKMVKDKFKK
jgi:hypothetical protein